jgi:hypothetical protein
VASTTAATTAAATAATIPALPTKVSSSFM